MSDTYDMSDLGNDADALESRISAVRELIGMLAITPASSAEEVASPPTAATFRTLCERLGRLLAQAGMMDCARVATNLAQASETLPADESLRAVDDALTYLRARIRDVALPPSPAAPTSTTVVLPAVPPTVPTLPAETNEADATTDARDEALKTLELPAIAEAGDMGGMGGMGDGGDGGGADELVESAESLADAEATADPPPDAEADAHANSVSEDAIEDAPPGDDDAFDENAFPTEARAAIRNFRNATLRQRAPGEVTLAPPPKMYAISDELPEPMRRAFLAEGASDLADLRALIASFSKMPGSLDDLHAMALLAHKVKGTAATYLYQRVADIMHCFQGVQMALRPVATTQAIACLSLLIRFADLIEAALAVADEQGDASEAQVAEAQTMLVEAQTLATQQAISTADHPGEAPVSAAQAISERSTIHLPAVHRGDDDSLLRIEPRQFDSLMHQADGLAMNRAMLAQSSEEIRRAQSDIEHVLSRLAGLSAQLNDLHPLVRRATETEQAGPSGPRWLVRRETGEGGYDDLELDSFTSFDEALRALSEAVRDASELSGSLQGQIQQLTRNSDAQRTVLRNMQQTIIHLRLVSLKSLADRITLAAYQVAQAEGKQVEVSISGEDTEIDRNISEALIPPLVQLARNAVTHGIESSAEREARQKPAEGKLWLRASYSNGEVTIEFGDDGRGVNPHQLIAAAVAAQILDPKHADYLSREQALRLMFERNLSTSDQANVIAGHGIGLDSVLADIQRLRGTVSVSSVQGKGTVFQIRVPISLSITRALHVRVDGNEYAIPFSVVRQMFTVPEASILVSLPDAEPAGGSPRFSRRMRIARSTPQRPLRLPDDPNAALYDEVPVFSLAELLGMEEKPSATHLALLMDGGQRQVVILVDEVLDESEVVIRSLPAHLRRKAVRGASITPDGRLFLVLDLADLLGDALHGKPMPRPQPKPAPEPSVARVPQALVVDDSISMRYALQGTLTNAGYEVRLARDGVEALGMMLTDLPDVMLLDLEMPRLDGFELLSVIRGNEALAKAPVVILTSKAAEKHHRQAMELGARAYLTKPCPDDVLITTLQRVLREP